jgi:hypothetical protein
VKEKYGMLRFYVSNASQETMDFIYACEEASREICESCGRQGRIREIDGWLTTLCDYCAEASDA